MPSPPGRVRRRGRSPRRRRRRRPPVEVWPSENRSEWRAASSSQPIASRTCEGCGTPAEQAEPVEHSMPAGVEQHQQRVALAAGEAEVGVAGQPVGRPGLQLGAVQVGVGHHLDHPADQVVAQRGDPGGVLGLVLDRELDRGREAGDRRGVDGAAADVALLAAAVHQRADRRPRGARSAHPRRTVRRACARSA